MENVKIICNQIDVSLNEMEKYISNGVCNKTNILNVEFHSGRLMGCLDILEVIDFEKFIEVAEFSKNIRQEALKFIDNLYKN